MHEIRIVIETHPNEDGATSVQQISLDVLANPNDLVFSEKDRARLVAVAGEVATVQAINEFLSELLSIWGGGNHPFGDPEKVYKAVLEEFQDAAGLYLDSVFGEQSSGTHTPSDIWKNVYRCLNDNDLEGGDNSLKEQ